MRAGLSRHPLWILFAVALAARVLPATYNFVIGADEGLFLTLGQSLAAGGAYTGNGRIVQADFPPGFPLFAAGVYLLGGGPELPAKLNVLLIGSLLPLPVYWLARGLGQGLSHKDQDSGHRAAFRAGLFTALLPALALATMNFEATAEPLYSLLLYTGWAALWWGLSKDLSGLGRPDRSVVPFLVSGLALGASHLVRWEGLILGLMGAAVIVLASSVRVRDSRLKSGAGRGPAQSSMIDGRPSAVGGQFRLDVLAVAVFAAALALFAGPYALFLKANTGSYVNPKTTITRLHSALIDASAADPFAFEKYYYDLEDVLADPVSLTRVPEELLAYRTPLPARYLRNLLVEARLWLTTASLLTVVWIAPAIIGAVTLPRGRALFLALLFAPLGAIPASVVDPRYFIPALPAAVIFAAFGWSWLERRLPDTPIGNAWRRLAQRASPMRSWELSTALIGATVALFAVVTLGAPFALDRPTEYRRAGLALRWQLPDGAHLLARKRQPAFYAGAVWEWLPFANVEGVIAYATARGADYILLDRRTAVLLRPQLAHLLDPANAPDILRPIYYDEAGGVVVYYIER